MRATESSNGDADPVAERFACQGLFTELIDGWRVMPLCETDDLVARGTLPSTRSIIVLIARRLPVSLFIVLINTLRLRNQITDYALQIGLTGALVVDFIELRDQFNREIPAKLAMRSASELIPLLKGSRSCHVKYDSNGAAIALPS